MKVYLVDQCDLLEPNEVSSKNMGNKVPVVLVSDICVEMDEVRPILVDCELSEDE